MCCSFNPFLDGGVCPPPMAGSLCGRDQGRGAPGRHTDLRVHEPTNRKVGVCVFNSNKVSRPRRMAHLLSLCLSHATAQGPHRGGEPSVINVKPRSVPASSLVRGLLPCAMMGRACTRTHTYAHTRTGSQARAHSHTCAHASVTSGGFLSRPARRGPQCSWAIRCLLLANNSLHPVPGSTVATSGPAPGSPHSLLSDARTFSPGGPDSCSAAGTQCQRGCDVASQSRSVDVWLRTTEVSWPCPPILPPSEAGIPMDEAVVHAPCWESAAQEGLLLPPSPARPPRALPRAGAQDGRGGAGWVGLLHLPRGLPHPLTPS